MSVVGIAAGIARTVEEDTGFDPAAVTPGVVGFLVTAVFALAVIFLGWDLGRRLRRNRYREEIRQSLEAELAERGAVSGAANADAADPEASGDAASAAAPDRAPGGDEPRNRD